MHLCEWGLGDPCAAEGSRGFTALDGGGGCKEQNGIGAGMPDLAITVAAMKAWLGGGLVSECRCILDGGTGTQEAEIAKVVVLLHFVDC
jgi:hypothetical protein